MNGQQKKEYEELLRSAMKISKETGTEMAVEVIIKEDGRVRLAIGPRTETEKATNTHVEQVQIITAVEQAGR